MDKLKIIYENLWCKEIYIIYNEVVWKEGVFEVVSFVYEVEYVVFMGLIFR